MITFAYADNSEAVTKSLGEFQGAITNQQPGLAQIADDFRELIARQFASEGRTAGTMWAARKSSLVGAAPRGRPGQGHSLPLLVRTGALRDSLTQPVAAGHVEESDRQTLSIGSRLPYALFHQTGTRRMPARPIIVLRDERTAKWAEFVRAAIEEKTPLLAAKQMGGEK